MTTETDSIVLGLIPLAGADRCRGNPALPMPITWPSCLKHARIRGRRRVLHAQLDRTSFAVLNLGPMTACHSDS
jgi:hypothetical protein